MNVGKTLFAQVMEFAPWKTFGLIVERHKGPKETNEMFAGKAYGDSISGGAKSPLGTALFSGMRG